MATYVYCRKCGFRIELPYKVRSHAPLIFSVKCPRCGAINTYSGGEVLEEGVYKFECPICHTKLFTTKSSKAKCPVCGSILDIKLSSTSVAVNVLETGRDANLVDVFSAIGALFGGLGGASRGKDTEDTVIKGLLGALFGAVAGAIVGTALDSMRKSFEREVMYL